VTAAAKDSILERIGREMASSGLDVLVASSFPNVVYTSGTGFFTQVTHPDRLAFVVMTPDRPPVFILCGIEERQARAESWIETIKPYVEFAESPIEILAEELRGLGVATGRVGVEKRHLAVTDWEPLSGFLSDAELVAADDLFDRVRAVKTPEEIEIIATAALATDAAIRAAFSAGRAGMTERELGESLVAECKARGGEAVQHLVLASGANGFKVHASPVDKTLEAGDVVRTDFGMTWGRYHSDLARTAFVGSADREQERIYRTLERVHQQVIAAMRPGVQARELHRLCGSLFEAAGLKYDMPHVGHSIGIGTHEKPMLHPFDTTPLAPGMVFMVEPLIRAHDGLYHTEDMVEITDDGPRIRSRSADWTAPPIISAG
jgi:Xaa-Pro aminopeptidase